MWLFVKTEWDLDVILEATGGFRKNTDVEDLGVILETTEGFLEKIDAKDLDVISKSTEGFSQRSQHGPPKLPTISSILRYRIWQSSHFLEKN